MKKKLIIKILILVLPFACLISYFNYSIDSNYIFHSNSEKVYKEIAQKLKNNISVYVPDNYENRNLQEELYRKIENVDTVVLGASRGRQINQSLFKGKLINSCVSSGTLEDVVAFSGMIFKLGVKPKTVIIETSPYLFNSNAKNYSNWQLNEKYYSYMISNLHDKKSNRFYYDYEIALFKELFSVSYLKINFMEQENNIVEQEHYVLSDVDEIKYKDIDHTFIMPDGVILYEGYVNGLANTQEKIESSTYKKDVFREEYLSMSKDNMDTFESLVNYYQTRGIEVVFFLAPYSPYAYDVFVENYPFYNEAEEYLNHFADDNNIKVVGSYSPHKYNLYDRWDFHDCTHPSRRTVEMIFKNEYADSE